MESFSLHVYVDSKDQSWTVFVFLVWQVLLPTEKSWWHIIKVFTITLFSYSSKCDAKILFWFTVGVLKSRLVVVGKTPFPTTHHRQTDYVIVVRNQRVSTVLVENQAVNSSKVRMHSVQLFKDPSVHTEVYGCWWYWQCKCIGRWNNFSFI